MSVSYGIIKAIDLDNKHDILHLCSTDRGSSGSPILNINTNQIIGIHRGSYSNHNFNEGTLVIFPIKEFISKMAEKNKNLEIKTMVLKPSLKQITFRNFSLGELTYKRIQNEINNLDNIKSYNNGMEIGFQIFGFIEDALYGVLEGPPNTYYEKGFFNFRIKYPKDYPWKPPIFCFLTPIFHPNINEFGVVNIDILRDQFGPQLTMGKIILSIQSLLDDPNVDEFVNEHAATLFKENKKEYEKTVRQYTSEFANFNFVQNELKKLNYKMELNVG